MKEHCRVGRRRAYEFISVAEGTKTLAEIRQGWCERQAKRLQSVRDITHAEDDEESEFESVEFKSSTEKNTYIVTLCVDEGFRQLSDCNARVSDLTITEASRRVGGA